MLHAPNNRRARLVPGNEAAASKACFAPSAGGDGDRSTDLPTAAMEQAETSAKLEALRGSTTQDKVFSAAQQANNKPVHDPVKDPFRNNFLSDGADRIIYSGMGTSTGSKPLKYPFLLNFGR